MENNCNGCIYEDGTGEARVDFARCQSCCRLYDDKSDLNDCYTRASSVVNHDVSRTTSIDDFRREV